MVQFKTRRRKMEKTFGNGFFYWVDYLCPVCKGGFSKRGMITHLSAKTRNSDLKHAKLYLKVMKDNGKKYIALENIKKWTNNHINSLKMLKLIGGKYEL